MKPEWIETVEEAVLRWARKIGNAVREAASLVGRIVLGSVVAVTSLVTGFALLAVGVGALVIVFFIATQIWEVIYPPTPEEKAWREMSDISTCETDLAA